ncbi:hypothetical protein [Desulfosarcina cetonica]|uniref:hypothetical protein n=1 Tax=Desulfosarcina cetonica TaxID=90730 RepID=UPI0006CF2C14|nr:hypothetical protein [Desulfosarcina cetonica]
MIMQRDRYDSVDAIMARPTNRTIDAAWQAAFAFHRQRPGAPASAMYLRGQVGQNQVCLPFQALFYCQRAHTWFHPVCPQCGSELALCQDDALLTRWGLGTYSDSVERFMYCPACSSHGGPPAFFVKTKKDGIA